MHYAHHAWNGTHFRLCQQWCDFNQKNFYIIEMYLVFTNLKYKIFKKYLNAKYKILSKKYLNTKYKIQKCI